MLESGASDPWSQHTTLMFDVAYDQAECDSLCGELASAEQRLELLSRRELDLIQACRVASLRANVSFYTGQFDRGVELGLQYLALAGNALPKEPTEEDLVREYARFRAQLGSRSIAQLADVPLSHDTLHARVLELLCDLTLPARWGNHDKLHDLIACRAATLCLEHGHTEAS
ncbi:MAG TPA: hypothetical protein VMF89_29800, partial [Polyangiales bacterium]|nr:hypothetical protein [Polyangiales bacterium]